MRFHLFALLFAVTAFSCSDNKGGGPAGAPPSTGNYRFSGSLDSVNASGYETVGLESDGETPVRASVAKTITHIIAISPGSGNIERRIAPVASDGSFSLSVDAGKPYVIVFVASGQSLVGPDMIAGILRIPSTGTDALAPVAAGSAPLGTITVDGTAQTATSSTTVATLLSSLGLTPAEATFLGSIDDLTLRAANPDIDGNGVIDALEDKEFGLDFHLRSDFFVHGTTTKIKFSDVVGAFPNDPTIRFNLMSAYAMYDASYYASGCAGNSGVDTTLLTDCAFDIRNLAGASVSGTYPKHSYSGRPGNPIWGPDFDATAGTPQELPGSASPVQLVYTMPGSKVLRFWNVRTRTIASLTADGTVVPFLKLNTSDNTSAGTMTSVEYKWMKRQTGSWVEATAAEVALIVGSEGGYAKFYTAKSGSTQEGFAIRIPLTSASGTIPWNATGIEADGASAVLSTATPAQFCSSAISYDDKLGLRIFAGDFAPNAGTTPCF